MSKPIIHSLKKDGDFFVINESVRVKYNIDEENLSNSTIDVDFNPEHITEDEATELAEHLLSETLNHIQIPKD